MLTAEQRGFAGKGQGAGQEGLPAVATNLPPSRTTKRLFCPYLQIEL